MASIHDPGTVSLLPGWEKESTRSLRDLRMALGGRYMLSLRKGNVPEANNCRALLAKVRAEIERRAAAGDKEAC